MRKKSRRRKSHQRGTAHQGPASPGTATADAAYRRGIALASAADYSNARAIFEGLAGQQLPTQLRALVENDLGTLDALNGALADARGHFERALHFDSGCDPARQNLRLLHRETDQPEPRPTECAPTRDAVRQLAHEGVRIAILSLLFNWPSTGGGTVHTAETGKFLRRAGYQVKHFYARFAGWGVGNVTEPLEHDFVALAFDPSEWNASEIQRRFRQAVDRFAPDYVIITDSWNFKPLLAEAVRGYRYFLRLAAQECVCPLNNVRLLVDDEGRPSACPKNQLATADACRICVRQRQHKSGSLHQAERELSGYGTTDYDARLRQSFAEAEGVLAVNPLIAAAVSPFAKAVHVVPSGFDPERFPWPWPDQPNAESKKKSRIFFAGIVNEYMKGFHVLHSACARLWKKRQDFEIIATSDPPGQFDVMTRFIGWQPQSELPRRLREADFLVFPTVAEEALGRSAVEAMGVGRPVIASRIGGLPFTVVDGLTGFLFEPGDVDDLAAKIDLLLDDTATRERMGAAGRQRFVEHFTWNAMIEQAYRRLLKPIPGVPPMPQVTSLPTNGTHPS